MEDASVPCMDLLIMIVPTLDVISDWVIVVRSIFKGFGSQGILFLVGFGFFAVSQWIRTIVETIAIVFWFSSSQSSNLLCWELATCATDNDDARCATRCAFLLTCGTIPLAVLLFGVVVDLMIGLSVVVERAIKLAICPLDLFLGCGYYFATGELIMVARDKLFFLTAGEKEFLLSQPWYLRYWHLWCSLVDGGRWRASVFCPWDLKHGNRDKNYARKIQYLLW